MNVQTQSRRDFLKTAAVIGAASAVASSPLSSAEPVRRRGIKLGLDNFSVRAMKWNAAQLIDYAAKLNTDSLFITDLGPFESRDDAYLRDLARRAADHSLQIHLGSWSICPTSKAFKKDWGTAEEHLALGLRMARALGSPVFRVVLGTQTDRLSEGGIEARIADTVKVLQSQRSRALDAGVKVAVENHSGDMQAHELVSLIEAAGRDYVGANLDSGNACWTLEDPLASLEILASYVLTTSLRDSMLWESANGVTVQWTAMGEGCTDLKTYFDRFGKLCPGAPVHIETISGFQREFAIYKPEFWKAFPKARAEDLARFVALAKKGKPLEPFKAPAGADKDKAQQDYQREEIERSIRFCKESLGLGLR